MAKYSHDDIVPYNNSSLGKKEQVEEMFDRIAFRYDFLNRFLSLGTDIYWRRLIIRELRPIHPQKVLDVATGTADVAIRMAKSLIPPIHITGIDISRKMLEFGRIKVAKQKLKGLIDLQPGDSEAINFPEATFDAVTVAFGVRNFAHLEKGVGEIFRVLKPGGKLVILEFSKPKNFLISRIYSIYMNTAAAGAGKLIAGNQQAYEYLHKSANAFPEGEEFLKILQKNGFKETYLKKLSLGICTIYCGRKD
jgi:demethylmenaquinone methyltransferase/2-methoxy-6-polyprenyl-1,4-benzoquinol methylase